MHENVYCTYMNMCANIAIGQDDDPNALWDRDDVEESEIEDVRERFVRYLSGRFSFYMCLYAC